MLKVIQVLVKTMDEKGVVKHWLDKDVTVDGATIKLNIPKEPKKQEKKESKSEPKKEEKKDSKSTKNSTKK